MSTALGAGLHMAPATMEAEPLTRVVGRLEPIQLAELGSATLMNRVDSKYLLPARLVPALLARCADDYRVLEVNGVRQSRYRTLYFDTPSLELYLAHHNGRLPRHKVRVRTYVESGLRFLEVKLTTNTSRTLKSRRCLPGGAADVPDALAREPVLGVEQAVAVGQLRAAVSVTYTRITLVHRWAAERVTLDLLLAFDRGRHMVSYPGAAIAEVKQERRAASRVMRELRALGVRQGAISKYCLGIASLDERVKKNRYKPVLLQLHKTIAANVLA